MGSHLKKAGSHPGHTWDPRWVWRDPTLYFYLGDATKLHVVITKQLQVLNIPLKNLRGLTNDGASVITGKTRGLAALLKKDVISLVAVHCVCHRLALACTDTNEELAVIKEVETVVTQLCKIFDNSPKKLAAYLKVQEEMKQLTLGARAKAKRELASS